MKEKCGVCTVKVKQGIGSELEQLRQGSHKPGIVREFCKPGKVSVRNSRAQRPASEAWSVASGSGTHWH